MKRLDRHLDPRGQPKSAVVRSRDGSHRRSPLIEAPAGVSSDDARPGAHPRLPRLGVVRRRAGWCAYLVYAAIYVPAYVGTDNRVIPGDTLVAENGASVLLPVSVPLVGSLAVWWLLHRRCSRGSERARRTANR